jgi:hypothetical protein
MKKTTILIMTSLILLSWVSSVYAAEILGYPLVEKQAKFYSVILGVIGASMALVFVTYTSFWLADWKKEVATHALRREKKALGGELAAAAQPAK